MLSIGAMSSGRAGYYLGLAQEDYYVKGGEPPGKWFGRGAEALGLQGTVEPAALYNLFAGLSPSGDEDLIQRQRHDQKAEHRPGWDLTFSAPKSVSVLWSQASPEKRLLIQSAHDEAVRASLEFLEEHYAFTRRGKGGKTLDPTGLIVATFEHSTSRALDPQLHTHSLVLNVGVREDGTTGTVSSLHLFLAKMTAGALYRAELSARLERDLGVSVSRHRSWFEVEGVSKPLIEAFSKRREAILETLGTMATSSARAAAEAALETREAKEATSRQVLFKEWELHGRALGWGRSEADSLFLRPQPTRDERKELGTAMEIAVLRFTDQRAHFSEKEFLRQFAEECQARGLSVSTIVTAAPKLLEQSNEIVPLGSIGGEKRFTTRHMQGVESELLKSAATLAGRKAQTPKETVEKVLAKHPSLSGEQQNAVRHVTNQTGGLALVSGMAGTGKTTMLRAAKEVWEQSGHQVIGVALAARAAKQLSIGAAIPAVTIAKLRHDFDRVAPDESPSKLIEQLIEKWGPDIMEPLRKLAEKFGPDVLDPVRGILEKHGPNILAPLAGLASRYGPDLMEPITKLAEKLGPDIGQAWRTLGSFLQRIASHSPPMLSLPSRSILIVDEAGMVDSYTLSKVAALCERSGAKLVLVGDERQLQPIAAGGPFASLVERYGSASLTEIRRQESQWARKAVHDLAAGRAYEAIREFAERGFLHVAESKDEAIARLIEAWHEGSARPQETLILAGTRSDVSILNRLAQSARLEAGRLDASSSASVGGVSIYVGDRVTFEETRKGAGITKGDQGTVESVAGRGNSLRVRLDSGDRVSVDLESYQKLPLGYASTTHRAQGATARRAYVLIGGGMQDREISYVQASRASEQTLLFGSKVELGESLATIAKQMERSRRKTMAADLEMEVRRSLDLDRELGR